MGLFRKNPAEKKLKELTGGFTLSNSFINRLERNNLSNDIGMRIKEQLKNEIKEGVLSEGNVEIRLNQLINKFKNDFKKCPSCHESQNKDNTFCINCGYNFKDSADEKTCPECGEIQSNKNHFCIGCGYDFNQTEKFEIKKDYSHESLHDINSHADFKIEKTNESATLVESLRKNTFLYNFDFNLKTCPGCGERLLKSDAFCFNCGGEVITRDTEKNENLEIHDGKLTQKTDHEELKDLEALYSQTVESKYSPVFKVAYVLFLDAFRKNPQKKFPDKTAKKYETTVKKLEKQAIEDGFIELAPAISEAHKSKVTDLKEILKEHNLKVSGKKDELIKRLNENLTEDELKKYFKSKNYQISHDGEEFLLKNRFILYLHSDKDITRVFYPSEIGKIFEEKSYTDSEIRKLTLNYLKRIFDSKLSDEIWVDFKIYANAIAQVLEDSGDLHEALKMRFKVFIFDVNNFLPAHNRSEPESLKLKKKDMVKLTHLMHEMTLPIDELKEIFGEAYDETLFESVLGKNDALVYLLKVFGGDDLESVSQEVRKKYSNPY